MKRKFHIEAYLNVSLRLAIVTRVLLPDYAFSQLVITMDSNPVGQPLPAEWRGHNHNASGLVEWYSNSDYDYEYGKLHAGIERWPGGNDANNYNWQAELAYPNRFNLRNAADYMDYFGTALQMVVNFGNGSPSETAQFVRFCNSNLPYYQNLRDSILAHPDPLNIKVWEIGNESTDKWAFAWSWLGYQDQIFFRSGEPPLSLSKKAADSMYYYGGEFYRQGWVEIIGGLDMRTAILGDMYFYTSDVAADTIAVEFPEMDTTDASAIRIYRTPDFNRAWADTLGNPGVLYDSIAQPVNLLLSNEYDYTATEVFLHPTGGIKSNDLILIEYLSTGHSGAFAFRDSIKANDPEAIVGYTVEISPELENMPGFIDDFRQSPPDFMVDHPYPTNITKPALENSYFSEAIYTAEFKVEQFIDFQKEWNQRKTDWNLAQAPGLGITEWNIALCDECQDNHPFDGIASALYVADFWGRIVEKAVQDSISLAVINHFGLLATGNNFIHLLRPVSGQIEVSPEGRAVQMLMEVIADGYYKVNILQMPTITILWDNGINKEINALSVYAGISEDQKRIQLLVVNRDDENAHQLEWDIPDAWISDSLLIETFTGSMFDSLTNYQIQKQAFNDSYLSVSVPAYSLLRLELKLATLTSIDEEVNVDRVSVYPNPATENLLHIESKNLLQVVEVYSPLGKLLHRSAVNGYQFVLPLNNLSGGLYILYLYTSNGRVTRAFIRQ